MRGILLIFMLGLSAFDADAMVLNNPYPAKSIEEKVYYSSFSEQPKTLDPARSYSATDYIFLAQIYEPLLQYHYFKRPYTLVPLTLAKMPSIEYLTKDGAWHQTLPSQKVVQTRYTFELKPNIYYQPHPAFAKDAKGAYRYHHLPPDFLDKHRIEDLKDFKYQGTRELVASDYVYQIKRLATPSVQSPIRHLMSHHIEGFEAFGQALIDANEHYPPLSHKPLSGARVLDRYRFEIRVKGAYPQFLYWLAMPFFAPMPWEADVFYHNPGMREKNITLDWYPVGTGPFMLTLNEPNREMILEKNPKFHDEFYPEPTLEADQIDFGHKVGLKLPLIDKAVFTLEKETIPRWLKFLQGYYDVSGISADSFDQAIRVYPDGQMSLSPSLEALGFALRQTVEPSIYYTGFNMIDPVVGGYSKRARALRQAISIAVSMEENIAIFLNGRGEVAESIIPPGIFGHDENKVSYNPITHQRIQGEIKRKSLAVAKQLMIQAGYPGGINPKTRRPLVLHYDVPSAAAVDTKAQFAWMRKQFKKLGIHLDVRATTYNRFQEKIATGHAQIFSMGWSADYPDPENFMFLLYGPNAKVKSGGENLTNYQNSQFDWLFDKMKNRPSDLKRLQYINEMKRLIQNDAPMIFGITPKTFVLTQSWVDVQKPNTIALNTLKYADLNPALRLEKQHQWNQAILWPMGLMLLFLVLLIMPAYLAYRHRLNNAAARIPSSTMGS